MAEYFNINLPDKYQKVIQNMKIENNFDPFSDFHNPSWKSFEGNAYDIIYNSILKASKSNSNELAKKCAKIINKILQLCINKLSKNMDIKKYHKLIWLRYRTESEKYDIPRWHIDGNYNINNIQLNENINQKKIIISISGPGTMVANCDKDNNKVIMEKLNELSLKYPRYENNELNIKNAKQLNDQISPYLNSCSIHKLDNFEGVIYNIGNVYNNKKNSCIHSEPKFNKSRLFLGLVLSEIK
tara:strand:- start:417 stop:1142 length:726 start_codon:yes stop_codon:yes gene_type:complete